VGAVGGEELLVLVFEGLQPDLQHPDTIRIGVADGAVVDAVPCPVELVEDDDPTLAKLIEQLIGPLDIA